MACAGPHLALTSFDDIYDDETPPVRRFIATFEDPGTSAAIADYEAEFGHRPRPG